MSRRCCRSSGRNLGHAEVVDTQRYLTITPELRERASERFARYAWGGRRE